MQQLMTKGSVATYDYKNLLLLNKTQLLELLEFLTERINRQFIMMGGLLYVIRKNKWYEPHATFMGFCDALTGIQYRKAMYLIKIYEKLVLNHIPFEDVSELGYTKMVLLLPYLTESNYKDITNWAKPLKIFEIEAQLEATVSTSKQFIGNAQASSVLQPDYVESTKIVKPNTSVLKNLLTITPIDSILKALKMLYPEKDFVLA